MSERRRRIRTGTVFILLTLLLLWGIWLEINAGYRKISPEEIWEILRGKGAEGVRYTLINLRLPREYPETIWLNPESWESMQEPDFLWRDFWYLYRKVQSV